MSFNRENVIWQSHNGTWSRGFFPADVYGDDPEWDVDYDFERFGWVATGLASEQAAEDAWTGANPGGWSSYPFERDDKGSVARAAKYDQMAADAKARRREALAGDPTWRRGW